MNHAARAKKTPVRTTRATSRGEGHGPPITVDFAPVEGNEQRPWDPSWYVYSQAVTRFIDRSQRLLNVVCDRGTAALRLARLGYQVDACDRDADNLAVARSLATRYALEDRCRFNLSAGQRLDYPDATFDLVIGFDALAGGDLYAAINDLHRVLKPGGVAIFKEALGHPPGAAQRKNAGASGHQALTDALSDLAPQSATPPLTGEDLRIVYNRFNRVEIRRFTIFNRLDRLFAARHNNVRARLRDTDAQLVEICPPLARLGGSAVIICNKAH